MQDTRIRLISTILLSIAAFASIWGAAGALAWWLVFTPSVRYLKKSPGLVMFLVPVLLVAAITEIMTGNGVSYGIRMGVIILIALWAYEERNPGDFLSLSVWFFGRRWGFDLGLAAEMSVQGIEVIRDDILRARVAHRIKHIRPGIRTIVPAFTMLIHQQMERAASQADILAIRGYRYGGSLCPVFTTAWPDIVAGSSAILLFLFGIFPVRDIFILLQ
jgi:energy-coupling factor transport system permease protein